MNRNKKFIDQHEDYFERNKEFIVNNDWHFVNTQKKKLKSPDAELIRIKTKLEGLKSDDKLVKNILNRLSAFIKISDGDRHEPYVQDFIDNTVDVIMFFIRKCDTYIENNNFNKIENTDVKDSEIELQDEIFNRKIKIQDALDTLNINSEVDNLSIKFYNNKKASLIMKAPLEELNTPIGFDIKNKVSTLQVTWDLNSSKEMFINMNTEDIPKWNPKKHFFDQDKVTIQFWTEEYNKIKNGININGFYVHPWLYFHLNYFSTPIPQEDGSEPNTQPGLRDNEWFFSENLKECISEEFSGYYSKAMLVYGTRRFAKALRDDQHLYYEDGSIRTIGKSKVGDRIFGSDGKPTKIIGVYPQGEVELYEVELSDGRKSICCDEHLWTVYDYQAKKYKTLPLKEIISDGWSYTRFRKNENKESTLYKYFLPINKEVDYKIVKELPIDPYYLGLWLGDGSKRTTAITTEDEEIKNFLIQYADTHNLRIRVEKKKDNNAETIFLVKTKGKENPIYKILRDYDLTKEKHIPEIFQVAPAKDRMELLRGMMDTDGTINGGGSDISFCSSSEVLAKDFMELARGLGIHSKITKYTGEYIKQDGELNTYYKVLMYTDKMVFNLPRKRARIDGKNKNRAGKIERVPIINIKKIENAKATCIRVDNVSKEFLTNDYIVTHNSVIMASLAHWRTITKHNSFGTIVGGSSSDLIALTDKVRTSTNNIQSAFRLDTLSQNWTNGETIFGIKEDASNSIIFSKLLVQNLEEGAKSSTQKTAGMGPSVSIYDEIGKYAFLKPYLAALPSFKTPYGFKCVTVLAGTGGEADLSQDAMAVLSNPEAYDLLTMNWDLLESKIDPEYITWKRRNFATFFPGQMAYEVGFIKNKKKFSDFIGIESEELSKIQIEITDWKKNRDLLLKQVEDAKKVKGSRGKVLEQQKKVQYPLDPEDCFLSAEENPFSPLEVKIHKERIIEEGDLGKKVVLYELNGEVHYEMAEDKPLPEFPFGGGFIDSPIEMFIEPPKGEVEEYLFISSLDDYKQEQSENSDSVGSFIIYRRNNMDEHSNKIAAVYSARPDPHKKLHEQGLMLLKLYNARCFPENEDMDFKIHTDTHNLTWKYLVKGINLAQDLDMNTNKSREFGWAPTTKNIAFGTGLLKNYVNEELVIKDINGETTNIVKGFTRINSVGVLEELQYYKKDGNFDRLRALMGVLMYDHYLTSQYIVPRKSTSADKERYEQKKKNKPKSHRTFAKTRGSIFGKIR